MILSELFNTSTAWKWIQQTPNRWAASVSIAGDRYSVNFWKTMDPVQGLVWEVGFSLMNDDHLGTIDIVGGKAAPQIFSVVIEIIRAFAANHRGKLLMFTAEEPSRVSLYRKLVKRLAPQSQMYYDDYEGMYYVVQM